MGLISNGTTIFDAGSMASGFGGSMTFIKKLTASSSGTLTFVKQFISRSRNTHHADYSIDGFVAGYCNVTAAIDGVQFKFASGNIDSGTIKMYGIK